MTLFFMGFTLLAEGFRVGVEPPEEQHDVVLASLPTPISCLLRAGGIGIFHRTEAAVASRGHRTGRSRRSPTCVTGPRHGICFDTITHTVPRSLHSMQTLCVGNVRLPLVQEGIQHFQELVSC